MIPGAKYGTPAFLAAQLPQQRPTPTQEQGRDRRRKLLPIYAWPGDWSLTAEVAAICDPLAERVAAATNPAAYLRAVTELADAVHQAVHVVVGLIAQADAERRTRHLGTDERGRSIRAVVDLAERPAAPEVSSEALVSGTWSATLVVLAEPYSAALARLLGGAATPTVSDRLLTALVEVDAAAGALGRRLDRERVYQANRAANRTASPADRARAELHELGVL
ncbi:hypothetical protein KQR54_05595 [Mycobacterium gordonae]|uniref:hypothetical protein n=1 Tax=Mycobacterium gordonae TaxID=1778 RepID=UPI002109785A|nr:hypothetical protein [Mycobacterium gordonae]MCQ4360624.1 hypothetical protein [Mycobacterium gordonae]